MIECAIPQDILKYKTKFLAGFSVRETVCLALGAAAGLGSYFTFLSEMEGQTKMIVAALFAVPFFLFGFLTPLGQPLEKILAEIIMDNLISPPVRKYEIRHPKYEKFLRGDETAEKIIQEADNETSPSEEVKPGIKKKKKKSSNSQEKKIAKSKEYKAIR